MDAENMSPSERLQIDSTTGAFLEQAVEPARERHSRSIALFLLMAVLCDYRRRARASDVLPRLVRAHTWLACLRADATTDLAAWLITARAALLAPDDPEAALNHLRAYHEDMKAAEQP